MTAAITFHPVKYCNRILRNLHDLGLSQHCDEDSCLGEYDAVSTDKK
jgi:hypothetical protein